MCWRWISVLPSGFSGRIGSWGPDPGMTAMDKRCRGRMTGLGISRVRFSFSLQIDMIWVRRTRWAAPRPGTLAAASRFSAGASAMRPPPRRRGRNRPRYRTENAARDHKGSALNGPTGCIYTMNGMRTNHHRAQNREYQRRNGHDTPARSHTDVITEAPK